MRAPVAILFVLGVAACTPEVPESGPGFQDYNSYMRERTSGAAAAPAQSQAPAPDGFSAAGATAALDRAQGVQAPPPVDNSQGAMIGGSASGGTGSDGARPRGNEFAGIQQENGEMARVNAINGNAGMSDENDFKAVSSRETIQSDKERIERNRAQYQIVQPGALPQRTGDEGPNIVQFALSTSHPVGTQMYSRSSFGVRSQASACAKFASPDLAQEWFLSNGGPEKDKRGLDPDGDGYACSWDPTPFRG
ncbi:MAG: hypothetical protein QM656_04205 [Paracoccaceae bacterium]